MERKSRFDPTHTPIHSWFGLSYVSFLTLPRVLMENMPQEWQVKMSELLKEYEDEFPGIESEIDEQIS